MNLYKKLLLEIVINNKKLCITGFIIMITMSILQIIIPLSMKEMISKIESKESFTVFLLCIIIYSLLWFVYNLVNVQWYKYIDKLGEKALWNIRKNIYHMLWNCDYIQYVQLDKNHLKNILYSDVINIYGNIISYSMNIIADTLMIITFLAVSFYISISTTFLLLFFIILGLIFSAVVKPIMAKNSAKVNNALKKDNSINNECIDAIELIRTNGLQEYYSEKIKQSIHNFICTAIKSDQVSIFLHNIMNHYHYVLSMTITGYLVLNAKHSNIGNIIYYIFITTLIIEKSQSIEENLYRFMKNMASFENVSNILKLTITSNEKNLEIENLHTITFENVSLSYSNQYPVFKNISFNLTKGDAALIKGINGSGKSSILKMIAGLIPPTTGIIKYNDISHLNIKKELLFKEICYLSQEELLLNESPLSYISIISHKEIKENSFKSYQSRVNLSKDYNIIKDNGKYLSGGEKKKFILMKLLARLEDVSIILLDEVESNLDKESKTIMDEIEKEILFNKEKYILIKVSHNNNKSEEMYNKIISL